MEHVHQRCPPRMKDRCSLSERRQNSKRQSPSTMQLFISVVLVAAYLDISERLFLPFTTTVGPIVGQDSLVGRVSGRALAHTMRNLHPPSSANATSKYHVIFPTACWEYENWQSYVFFYHALKSGQQGTITRIASGCSSTKREASQRFFREHIQPMSDRFRFHVTPNYASKLRHDNEKQYTNFNIPFGVLHWLEDKEALHYPKAKGTSVDDDVVILMTLDQLLLRPFTDDFSESTEVWYDKERHPNQTNPLKVQQGLPFAQAYRLSYEKNGTALFPNVTDITLDKKSPANNISRNDTSHHFQYGPPYIATARDMYRITQKWTEFVPRVHDVNPDISAEMYAYAIASAHLGLRHQTARSFMVADVNKNTTEAWSLVDVVPKNDVCRLNSYEHMPHTIRYNQEYKLGKHYFHAEKIPERFVSCESGLLREPSENLGQISYYMEPGEYGRRLAPANLRKRNAFALCSLLPGLNEASENFKQYHCDAATANFSKSVQFTMM